MTYGPYQAGQEEEREAIAKYLEAKRKRLTSDDHSRSYSHEEYVVAGALQEYIREIRDGAHHEERT